MFDYFVSMRLEGISPELALKRIAKSVKVYKAKKTGKTEIVFSVRRKEVEKVFAIYKNMCYNSTRKGAYQVEIIGNHGFFRFLPVIKKRIGVILGSLIFVFITLYANFFVLDIKVVGETSKKEEVENVLSSYGVKRFVKYDDKKNPEITADVLSIGGVSFASVKKQGYVLIVEVRTSPYRPNIPVVKDLVSKYDGEIVSLAVLRGNAVLNKGDKVKTGDIIVFGDDENNNSPAIARVVIRCESNIFVKAETEDDAYKQVLGNIDGEIVDKKIEKGNGGFYVFVKYEVIQYVNL